MINTFALTIIPPLAILSYFVFSDRFKEPNSMILKTFFLGIAITIPAGYLNTFILDTFENGNELREAFLSGFIGGGPVEEILKFLILYHFILREKEFNEPMDGIVYGVTASLGFATLENIDYVFYVDWGGVITSKEVAFLRSFSAIPLHGLCGVIMGFYFGKYVFTGDKKNMYYSILIPILIHGSYNFIVSFNFILALIVIILALIFSIKFHSSLRNLQNKKNKEKEIKKI